MAHLYICKCSNCGREFLSKTRRSIFCSYKCRYKTADKTITTRLQDDFEPERRSCTWCGKPYMTTYKWRSSFCSKKCQNAAAKANRKRRLKGKIVDKNISLQKVDKRFNHRCALCGGKVDWNDYTIDKDGDFIAGPNYPSIDHIVPLSQGGMHEWNNVQLAHFYCNSIKGASFLTNFVRTNGRSHTHRVG